VDSYDCYQLVAGTNGAWEEGARRLRERLDGPHHPRGWHILARMEEARGGPAAIDAYAEAVDHEAAAGDWYGVVRSLVGRAFLLGSFGRLDEAAEDLDRARKTLEKAGDPELEASVWIGEGVQANRRADYGRARSLFRRAEAVVFPDGDFRLRSSILSGLGFSSWAMGDLRGAMEYYRREAEMLHDAGARHREASPRYNVALMAGQLYDKQQMDLDEVERLTREALDIALRTDNRTMEAASRRMLGQILEGEAGIEQYRKAAALDTTLTGRLEARRFIATEYAELGTHRDEAVALADDAIRQAQQAGLPESTAYGLIARAFVEHAFGDPRDAVQRYALAQDQIEKIRDLQPEGSVRAGFFARFSHAYYRPSGALLRLSLDSSAPEADIGEALRILERLRARTLLDRMDAAGVSIEPAAAARPLHEERAGILERIATVQRGLLQGATADRDAARETVAVLEAQEADLRDRIARVDPRFRALRSAPPLPDLPELQRALAPDEALLSYQLWYERDDARNIQDSGGAWVVVLTREDVRVFPIPDRPVMRDRIDMFRGLLESRDGSDAHAATILYRDLLREPLASLPPGIRRLTIVPDSHLFRLPFAALRALAGDPPLALRYGITVVPSITAWLHWRSSAEDLTASRILALADPVVGGGDSGGSTRDLKMWEGQTGGVGPLPYTRREAAAAVAGMGGRLVAGGAASEALLKTTALSRYGLLYLAAHAVVDPRNPERSAILLAPGAPTEDGLLQVREIVDLDLDGQVVVLSTCRSASGRLLEGEGALNLARAFFLAGARSVVATQYEMRDDETAALMERFAAALAAGSDLASALSGAQAARVEEGEPAMAWAGVVVVGDGNVTLTPVREASTGAPAPILVVLGLLGLLLLRAVRFRGKPGGPRAA
jgi:CHAT domain-containing protein